MNTEILLLVTLQWILESNQLGMVNGKISAVAFGAMISLREPVKEIPPMGQLAKYRAVTQHTESLPGTGLSTTPDLQNS